VEADGIAAQVEIISIRKFGECAFRYIVRYMYRFLFFVSWFTEFQGIAIDSISLVLFSFSSSRLSIFQHTLGAYGVSFHR